MQRLRGAVLWGTISLCLSVAACQPQDDGLITRSDQGMATPIGADEAIAIALKRLGLPEDSTSRKIEAKQSRSEDWWVWVWALPPTPGGFTIVVVSREGRVREVIPGH